MSSCNLTDEDDFLLTHEQKASGGILVHFFLMVYLLAAVVDICQHYFVHALENICEDLSLQANVAGATFMAIGSSAPEMLTHVIALFFLEDEFGVGTVAGSAIFNLLFVIACCGIFGGMTTQLSWFSLTRDTIFYMFAVVEFIFVIHDSNIFWYESTIMVCTYIPYIIMMVFSKKIEFILNPPKLITALQLTRTLSTRNRMNMIDARTDAHKNRGVKDLCLLKSTKRDLMTVGMSAQEADNYLTLYKKHGSTPSVGTMTTNMPMSSIDHDNRRLTSSTNTNYFSCDTVVSVWSHDHHGDKTKSTKSTKSHPREKGWSSPSHSSSFGSFRSYETKSDGNPPDHKIPHSSPPGKEKPHTKQPDKNSPHSEDRPAHAVTSASKKWLSRSSRGSNKIVADSGGHPGQSTETEVAGTGEVEDLMDRNVEQSVSDVVSSLRKERNKKEDYIIFFKIADWLHKLPQKAEPFRMPSSRLNTCVWVLGLPYRVVHYCTIPRQRVDHTQQTSKVHILTFLFSILYMGLYTYSVVWLSSHIAVYVMIPSSVIGATVLAAGTSIPNLISSVSVARNGYGDMAVSNVIGSNCFDILMGLGIPWTAHGYLHEKTRFKVYKDINSSLLLGMLLPGAAMYLWCSLFLNRWRITKNYGYFTMVIYFALGTFIVVYEWTNDECT